MRDFVISNTKIADALTKAHEMVISDGHPELCDGISMAARMIAALPMKELVTVRSRRIVRKSNFAPAMLECDAVERAFATEQERINAKRQLVDYLQEQGYLEEKIEKEKCVPVDADRITLELTIALPCDIVRFETDTNVCGKDGGAENG